MPTVTSMKAGEDGRSFGVKDLAKFPANCSALSTSEKYAIFPSLFFNGGMLDRGCVGHAPGF